MISPPDTLRLVARDSYWVQRAQVTNAYARRRGAPGAVTAEHLRTAWSGTCHWCDTTIALGRKRGGFPLATVDHVVRIVDGGANEDHNVVWACRGCNESRNELAQARRA